jgi:NADH dehydrogenase (ubiquinone) 1 alpha subcomplex subunit 8
MATFDHILPTDEELNVSEVNLSSASLRAGAFHMGKYCENQNNVSIFFLFLLFRNFIYDFFVAVMFCRQEVNDPRKYLTEGRAFTACALEYFWKIRKSYAEFTQYANC